MVGYDMFGNGEDDDDDDFVGRICYVFNTQLPREHNDTRCIHCRKFMTLECEHIGDFIDGDD